MNRQQAEFLGRMRTFIHDYIVGSAAPLVSDARHARLARWGTAPTTGYQQPPPMSAEEMRLFGPDVPDVPRARATREERGEEIYAAPATRTATRRQISIGQLVDELQDRLYEPVSPPWESGPGGALRGARMFGPTERRPGGPLYRRMAGSREHPRPVMEQEQALSYDDQELLLDLAAIMRSVAGTAKAYLGSLLQRATGEYAFRHDEQARLKMALEWLRLAETAFRSVPMQIDLVRARREGRKPTTAVKRGSLGAMLLAQQEGLPAAVRAQMSTYVVDDETDEPMEKEIDDGDVFNDFAAAVGATRLAWSKIAMAMVTAPEGFQAPVEETAAAFREEGLPTVYGWEAWEEPGKPAKKRAKELYRQAFGAEYSEDEAARFIAEQEALAKPATPNRRMTPNDRFGWPRVAFE